MAKKHGLTPGLDTDIWVNVNNYYTITLHSLIDIGYRPGLSKTSISGL
jgi:hypothetical protein